MRGIRAYLSVGLIATGIWAGGANAAGVAMVEDVSAPRPGLEAMDYLSPGQMIVLGPGDRLVVNYLRSCNREVIVGGVVSVGAEQSVVVGGTVTRAKVECDGGKGLLTAEQASKSGVMVFRGIKRPSATSKAPAN